LTKFLKPNETQNKNKRKRNIRGLKPLTLSGHTRERGREGSQPYPQSSTPGEGERGGRPTMRHYASERPTVTQLARQPQGLTPISRREQRREVERSRE